MQTNYDTGWRTFLIGCAVLWVSFSAPAWLGNELGYAAEVDALNAWIAAQDTPLFVACLAAQTGVGFAIIVIAYAGACWIAAASLDLARQGSELIARAIRSVANSLKLALVMTAQFYFRVLSYPFILAGELTSQILDRCHQRLIETARLHRLYRSEFAGQFDSYAAFKRNWQSGQRHGDGQSHRKRNDGPEFEPEAEDEPAFKEARAPETYREALVELGLKEPFTQAMFKAVYRRRMKEAHPDLAGSDEAATRLNQARDLIKKTRGWT